MFLCLIYAQMHIKMVESILYGDKKMFKKVMMQNNAFRMINYTRHVVMILNDYEEHLQLKIIHNWRKKL